MGRKVIGRFSICPARGEDVSKFRLGTDGNEARTKDAKRWTYSYLESYGPIRLVL